MAASAPLAEIPEAPIPEGGAGEWFTGAKGARLRAALFRPKGDARGSVVLSGGRTEPIEKYFEVVRELQGRGFVVLCHDWRGQGLSQRLLADPSRGHAAGYHDFLDDYDALIAAFEDRLPKPWIAIGHSMGGCLTLLVLARGETRFAGAMLSAPMLGLVTGSTPKLLAQTLAAVLTAVGAGGGRVQGRRTSPINVHFDNNVLTHDAARFARSQAQIAALPELALGGPTWGWLDFAYKAMTVLEHGSGVTRIAVPLTVVAAGGDKVVDIEAQRRIIGRIPGARFVTIPGAHHETLQETDDIRAVFWREFDELVARL